MDSASPFAGLLIGQPTLATRLRQGIFAALDQRISVRYAIGGMEPRRVGRLPAPPSRARGQDRSAHRRRRCREAAPLCERDPPCAQQRRMAGLMAAAADGKGLVDDLCAKKAVAELTRT